MSFNNKKDTEKVLELIDFIKTLRNLTDVLTVTTSEYNDKVNNIANTRINTLLEDLKDEDSSEVIDDNIDLNELSDNILKRAICLDSSGHIDNWFKDIDNSVFDTFKDTKIKDNHQSIINRLATFNSDEPLKQNDESLKDTNTVFINNYTYYKDPNEKNDNVNFKLIYTNEDIKIHADINVDVINIELLITNDNNKTINDSLRIIADYLFNNKYNVTSPTFLYLVTNIISYLVSNVVSYIKKEK